MYKYLIRRICFVIAVGGVIVDIIALIFIVLYTTFYIVSRRQASSVAPIRETKSHEDRSPYTDSKNDILPNQSSELPSSTLTNAYPEKESSLTQIPIS
jgi:hypothetical protein